MMTKQAELKKRAYSSNLKSRALSILIYLIDRSNKELTCFPAIPTMAEQLHISISTVKRALHELVDAGFIQKDSRFRDNNRGQTSNLYTLAFNDPEPTPEQDNNLDHEGNIDVPTENTVSTTTVTHISFATLQAEKQEQAPVDVTSTLCSHAKLSKPQKAPCKAPCTPVQYAPFTMPLFTSVLNQAKEKAGHFLPCKFQFYEWTGAEVNLQPP